MNGDLGLRTSDFGQKWGGCPILVWLVAMAGCWDVPHPRAPQAATELPGVVWETPRQPWQMREVVTALAVAEGGATAIVGGAEGWVAILALSTGAIVREVRLGDAFTLYDFAHLADGRWVAVGNDGGTTRAVALAADTLAPTEIHLGVLPDRHAIHAGVAVMPGGDGGVIIAGKGLPLAIYDPATWRVRDVIAGELGWNKPRVSGTTLAVMLGTVAYRFDLAAPGRPRTAIGPAATTSAIAARVALAVFDEGAWWTEVWDAGARLARIAQPLRGAAIADDGTRLVGGRPRADGETTELAIYEAPFTGAPVATVPLGPASASGVLGITLDTDGGRARAIVSTWSLVRVVDLAAKSATAAGAAPWSAAHALALGADGAVVAVGDGFAWWLDARTGAVATALPFGAARRGVVAPDDVARIAVALPGAGFSVFDRTGVVVVNHGLARDAERMWLGGATGRAIAVVHDGPVMTLASGDHDGALAPGLAFGEDTGALVAVEPDAGVALVGAGGTIYVADARVHRASARGLVALVAPGCSADAGGELELRGTRATTFAGRDVALWDRTTGAALGTQRFAREVQRTFVVAGEPEIVVQLPAMLALWVPGKSVRALAVHDVASVAVDAHHIALGFLDGRVALLDRAAVRAAAAPVPLARIVVSKHCREGADPFAVEPAAR